VVLVGIAGTKMSFLSVTLNTKISIVVDRLLFKLARYWVRDSSNFISEQFVAIDLMKSNQLSLSLLLL